MKIFICLISAFVIALAGVGYAWSTETTTANPNAKVNKMLLDNLNSGSWKFIEYDGIYLYAYKPKFTIEKCDKATINLMQDIALVIENETGNVYPIGLISKNKILLIVTQDEIIYKKD